MHHDVSVSTNLVAEILFAIHTDTIGVGSIGSRTPCRSRVIAETLEGLGCRLSQESLIRCDDEGGSTELAIAIRLTGTADHQADGLGVWGATERKTYVRANA